VDENKKSGLATSLYKVKNGRVEQPPVVKVEGRKITDPLRGEDGLCIQPTTQGPERELEENHKRLDFANHANYADMYTGNTRTYDPEGNYNCGRCNKETKSKCTWVFGKKELDPLVVDEKAGSCRHWENKCAGDPEMMTNIEDVTGAAYGVAKNGAGFGCHRCPFASKAHAPDSQGRSMYCGKGDFRVFPTACCKFNGAPTK
jgi:hypothetical protein